MAVTQLQDELHSKNQELTRSRMETQQALQDISQLKQVEHCKVYLIFFLFPCCPSEFGQGSGGQA